MRSSVLPQIKTIWSQSVLLTKANLQSRYRKSMAGYLWVFLSPLSSYLAQAYVFKMVFKVQIDNYFIFLLFGLVPWIFFAQTLEMTASLLFHNGRMLKSLTVNPFSLIMAQVFDNIINSLVVMTIILCGISVFSEVPYQKVLLFPLPYVALGIFTVSWSFFFSALHLKFFDVKFVLSFVLGILFYLSPILYPEIFVPEEAKFLIYWNPLYYVLKPFKDLLSVGFSSEFLQSLAISMAIAVCSLAVTYVYWRRKRDELYLKL